MNLNGFRTISRSFLRFQPPPQKQIYGQCHPGKPVQRSAYAVRHLTQLARVRFCTERPCGPVKCSADEHVTSKESQVGFQVSQIIEY
jgi:hypothetical protein